MVIFGSCLQHSWSERQWRSHLTSILAHFAFVNMQVAPAWGEVIEMMIVSPRNGKSRMRHCPSYPGCSARQQTSWRCLAWWSWWCSEFIFRHGNGHLLHDRSTSSLCIAAQLEWTLPFTSEGQLFAYFFHATLPGCPRPQWPPQPLNFCSPTVCATHLPLSKWYLVLHSLVLHILPCITYTALCHIYYLVLHILPCITRLWDIPSPKLQELQAQSWNFFLFSLFVERLKKIENANIPNNQRLTTQTDSRLFKVREKRSYIWVTQ